MFLACREHVPSDRPTAHVFWQPETLLLRMPREGSGVLIEYAADLELAGDEVFVVDRYANRVLRFSRTGDLLGTVGNTGSGPGELRNPARAIAGFDGTLWIADSGNDRLARFDETGRFVEAYSSEAAFLGFAFDASGDPIVPSFRPGRPFERLSSGSPGRRTAFARTEDFLRAADRLTHSGLLWSLGPVSPGVMLAGDNASGRVWLVTVNHDSLYWTPVRYPEWVSEEIERVRRKVAEAFPGPGGLVALNGLGIAGGGALWIRPVSERFLALRLRPDRSDVLEVILLPPPPHGRGIVDAVPSRDTLWVLYRTEVRAYRLTRVNPPTDIGGGSP